MTDNNTATVRVAITLEVPEHNIHIYRAMTDAWPTNATVERRLINALTELAQQLVNEIKNHD